MERIRQRVAKIKDENFFENCPFGVLLLDSNLNIENVNSKFLEMTGFLKETLKTENIKILFPEKRKDKVINIQNFALSKKIIEHNKTTEKVIIKTNNSKNIVTNFYVAKINSNFICLIETNQTEVHNKKLQTMGEIATSVVHEINQPLTGIRGYCEDIISSINKQSFTQESILASASEILKNALRIDSITQNIRRFVSPIIKEKKESNINNAINEAVSILKHDLKIYDINIITNLSEKIPETIINENDFVQIFTNIILNSKHALLEKKEKYKKIIEIESSILDENKIKISIKDNGIGVKPEVVKNLFNKFSTTKENGTGIGLSISKKIIKSYGGSIYYNEENKNGTEFIIIIPVKLEVL